jgi:hypothetical protein
LKVQRLQSRIFSAIGNLDRRTPVRGFHVALKIPYVYYYISKLYRTQAEVILNHINPNVRGTGQGGARHMEYKKLQLGGGPSCDRSDD